MKYKIDVKEFAAQFTVSRIKRTTSTKEEKLIKILDFAQIEKNITVVNITNTPKDRVEIASAFGGLNLQVAHIVLYIGCMRYPSQS